MLNIGFGEMIIIGLIILIFIDPRELPQLSRKVGRMLGDLKRATSEVTSHFNDVTESTRQKILAQREEIRSQVDLKEVSQSLNQNTDEFMEQVRKELDELEALDSSKKNNKSQS